MALEGVMLLGNLGLEPDVDLSLNDLLLLDTDAGADTGSD
jgi:hypothetical protein